MGWTEAQFRERSKSDPGKLALAARLKRKTTLTMGWNVGRLQTGMRKGAVAKLHRWKKQRGEVDSHFAKTMV